MNRKMLRKRLGVSSLAACVLMGLVLGGCGDKPKADDVSESSVTESQVTSNEGSKEASVESSAESSVESSAGSGDEEENRKPPVWMDESTIVLSEDDAYLFGAIDGWLFTLDKPGAATLWFSVDKYGRFFGYSDYGADDYPEFSGIFGQVIKTSEFTYEATVADLICEKISRDQEISFSSDAYGISKTDKVEIYLPGARIEDLPKGFQDSIPDDKFRARVSKNYYVDVPLELPFCGIYIPRENMGLCSRNVAGKNLIYFTNKGNFPGLKNKSLTIDEAQGTYRCFDEQKDGLYGVFNLCFRPEKKYDIYTDWEEFAQVCTSQVTENVDFDEVYFFKPGMVETTPNLMHVNGDETMYGRWYVGSGSDEREYLARIMMRGEYAYVYGYWTADEDEYMSGVAGSFFLSSLTFTGNPEKISAENPDHAVRKIYGIVKRNGDDPNSVLVDEIRWSTERYESGVGFHWVLSGDDGKYKAMQLSESCSIYLLEPEEGPLWCLQNRSVFQEKLKRQDQYYLMELYLDENDQVTFFCEEDRT